MVYFSTTLLGVGCSFRGSRSSSWSRQETQQFLHCRNQLPMRGLSLVHPFYGASLDQRMMRALLRSPNVSLKYLIYFIRYLLISSLYTALALVQPQCVLVFVTNYLNFDLNFDVLVGLKIVL